jgi:glycerophosphoryl diester phosphodiesterase
MDLTAWLESLFYRLAARYCDLRRPDRPAAGRWGVIAHRGAHAPGGAHENTIAAFDRALAMGVDGIELDVRWTADRRPVVSHDPDLWRVFGLPHRVADLPLAELKIRCPKVPTLREVIVRYGRRAHLMVEFKPPLLPRPEEQNRRLADIFTGLRAGRDYHLMALDPALFRRLFFAPAATYLPIARTQVRRLSKLALENRWGGVAGHYLLVPKRMIARHHHLGQCVGTGFADTPASLFREVERGVDWIFTDNARALQSELTDGAGSLTKARRIPPARNSTRMAAMLRRAAASPVAEI